MRDVIFWQALMLTALAGMATGLGGLISILFKTIDDKYIAFTLSFSAGVMIYISFMEIMPSAIENINLYAKEISAYLAVVVFFAGIGLMAFINRFIDDSPRKINGNKSLEDKRKQALLAGIITSLGIIIHNIPEGMAAFVSSAYDIQSGLVIVLAIALHNIPEGLCIASAFYYATQNKKRAFLTSLIAGIAEPIGGILAYFLFKSYINAYSMSIIYSLAAGVMVYIALQELLAKARTYGSGAVCFLGWALGMIIISVGLLI